jgi:outer membrane protein OmpA-like peptidoglycan-associated protein
MIVFIKNILGVKTGNQTIPATFPAVSLEHIILYSFIILIILFSAPFDLSAQHKKVETYYTNGKLQSKGSTYTYSMYYDIKKMIRSNILTKTGKVTKKENEWKYWYQNGQLARIEHYKLLIDKELNDLPDGKWIYYNGQGVKYREDLFKNGDLESGEREIYCDSGLVGKVTIQNGKFDTILYRSLTKPKNLIINPDFDFYYYKPVPIIYHGNCGIEAWVPFWATPGEYTPDYISNLRFIDLFDYNFLFDFKLPEKFNYIGIAIFKDDDDYSEYIQGKLTEPLIKGKTYCFKISINSTRFTKYLVNHLACNFSPTPIMVNDQNEDSFSPQITFPYLPTEPKEFVTLCGYFIAKGGEKYLTIGRFIKKGDLSVTVKDSFPKSQFNLDRSSYYLIDKVELLEIHDSLECNCRTLINKLQINQKQDDNNKLRLNTYFSELKKGEVVVLNNVNFDFDSYILLKSSEDELNTFLQFLLDNPELKFRIDGYTDNIGTDEYNQELSIKRAKSVYNWLVNKGIQPSRLDYKGFGKRQPLINATDDKSRAINRRVEVQIINK